MIYTVLFPPSYSPVTGPRRNPASTSTTTYKTMTTILSARDRLSTFYASNPLLFQKGYAVRRSDLRRLLRRALANDLTNFRFVSNGRGQMSYRDFMKVSTLYLVPTFHCCSVCAVLIMLSGEQTVIIRPNEGSPFRSSESLYRPNRLLQNDYFIPTFDAENQELSTHIQLQFLHEVGEEATTLKVNTLNLGPNITCELPNRAMTRGKKALLIVSYPRACVPHILVILRNSKQKDQSHSPFFFLIVPAFPAIV